MLPTISTGNVASALVGEYDVANSLRFNDGSSDYLTRTFGNGNRKTFTFSTWIKRSKLGGDQELIGRADGTDAGSNELFILGDGRLGFGRWNDYILRTEKKLRDVSAWYHIVLRVDSTLATADDRTRIYINGVQETNFEARNNMALNYDFVINSNVAHLIGGIDYSGTIQRFFNGYMAEVCFIDGQSLDATSFGEFDSDSPNIWKPIDVSGLTFGTNGFHLDFENASSLGADVSGNSNNFTVNNLTSIDQSTDTCTNNGCTLVNASSASATYTLSEGNLKVEKSASNWYGSPRANMGVRNGKWYYECKVVNKANGFMIGYMSASNLADVGDRATNNFPKLNGFQASGYIKRQDNTEVNISSSFTWANGDIAQIALDMDNKKLWVGKNGSYYNNGNPASGTNEGQFNFGSPPYSISSGNADANGHGNFEYAVPSGYFALNTKKLAENG